MRKLDNEKKIEQAVKENTDKILKQINDGIFNDLKDRLTNPEFFTRADYRVQCAMNDLRPERKQTAISMRKFMTCRLTFQRVIIIVN